MYVLKTLMRAYTILNTCAAYRIDQFINPFIRRFWMRQFVLIVLFLSNPRAYIFNSSKIKTTAKAVRCRKLLEDLGPVFVKFGQALSTRRDLIAEDFADQLRLLQDQVPPFPATQAISIIEAELGQKLTACFATFDSKPMASASVAQVHAARLKTGEEVVIKVIRPDIANTIKLDINLMLFFARLFLLLWPASRKLHLVAVIKDYRNTIHHELNLSREAANATQLRYHFQDSDLLYVPTIHWQYTTSKVMTMERIFGIPLTDIHALKTKGINLKKLAERGTEIFYTQVFHHAFFHADMHPGNIFVDPDRPDQPRYLGIDFGIMGSLAEEDQYYLAHNFLAFFRRDYKRVAALHIASGWVAEHTDLLEMEAAIRTVCEPVFARPLKDISFGRILIQLFHIARQFDMEVQPQLVLLQKTLLQVEGLGRQIYPDLNPWQTGQPILEQWLKQRVAPWHVMKRMIRKAPEWLDQLPDLPVKILAMLDHIEQQLDSMQQQSKKNKKSKHKTRAHYK